MNKMFKAIIHIPVGTVKICLTKIFHLGNFHASPICSISPMTEITLEHRGSLTIGKKFKMRDGAKIRVRNNAVCKIGNNVFMNSNNIITCHESIVIGNNVQFGPNVLIYDHDHDFRAEGGITAEKYRSAPVSIGNNVWIGANSVILRGTIIGDNVVIGAGSVIKGEYQSGSVIVQKRTTSVTII